jgi:Fe-S-cluster containining protein
MTESNWGGMHLPPMQYDCISCGKSCAEFQVEITGFDLNRLRQSASTKALEKSGFTPLKFVGSDVFLEKTESGSCCFLSDEARCRLHEEGGFALKPTPCQTFPFSTTATPDGVYVGLSYACTAVVQSKGRELVGRESELQYLITSPDCDDVAADSQWSLWGSQAVDWGNYLQIEEFCRRGVHQDPRYGLLEVVWRLAMAATLGDLGYLSRPLGGEEIDLETTQILVRKLIPIMESVDRNVSQSIVRAIAENKGFDSAALGHHVELVSPPNEYPDWLKLELTRYLEHVLFRKSLLKAPNVLSRVCLLVAAEELIATYAYSRAAYRQSELELEDYQKAVGLVESRLMLHSNGFEQAYGQWAEFFVELLTEESQSPERVAP